ncbi:MAG: hexose kinase [Chloroflexi bacterium]|nr:hexose kinase [Chloroflexota bacterium]
MQRETIICVTPNAALDRTLVVPDFAIGHISRIPNAIAVPGGKGLNVLRAIEILGGRALAMGLLGGHTGRTIAAMLEEDGYRAAWTRFAGETRTCTIIATPDGNSTVINESGQIAPGDWTALADDICQVVEREHARTVCLCGSLPLGAPADAPADLIERAKMMGARLWVDSSKRWLKNAILAKPYAIKVNREELLEALGAEAKTQDDIVALARGMNTSGIEIVVISLGAEGALLVSESLAVKGTPPVIQALDPVASGDCLHAGIVTALADGADLAEALRRGVAAGTVNALYAGGAQFPQAHYLEVLAETSVESLAD